MYMGLSNLGHSEIGPYQHLNNVWCIADRGMEKYISTFIIMYM